MATDWLLLPPDPPTRIGLPPVAMATAEISRFLPLLQHWLNNVLPFHNNVITSNTYIVVFGYIQIVEISFKGTNQIIPPPNPPTYIWLPLVAMTTAKISLFPPRSYSGCGFNYAFTCNVSNAMRNHQYSVWCSHILCV